MYTLNVTNHYWRPIVVNNSAGSSFTVDLNRTGHPAGPLGDATITVPGQGEMMLHDIGDRQIGGFSTATWGVLVAFKGEEVVFRYEAGGVLNVTFNDLGQAQLTSNGGFSRITLDAVVLPGDLEE